MKMKMFSLYILALVGMVFCQSFYAAKFTNATKKSVRIAANRSGSFPAASQFRLVKNKEDFAIGSNRYLFVWTGGKNTIRYDLPIDANTRLKKDAFGTFKFGYVNKKHNKKLTSKKFARVPEVEIPKKEKKTPKKEKKTTRPTTQTPEKKAYKILKIKKGEEVRKPWKALGIKQKASDRDAIKAYRKLSLKWHPDSYYRHEDEFKKEGITQDDVIEVFKILTTAREQYNK